MLTFENVLEIFMSTCCTTRRKKFSLVNAAMSD